MATPTFNHGMDGRVVADNTTLNVEEWTFTATTATEDVTHMESEKHEEVIKALRSGEGSLKMTWDAANPALSDPPDLNDGSEIAMKLYIDKAAGVYWNIPKAFITSTPMTANVATKITFEANFKANGTFSMVGI